ncbi:fumarylacetoacetate hydrolase family protein [Umezawaea tangerina]|uniref:2-keto-4-pentenoate hydratase/2-oxohepta-3-ene-1,7-dioic acid hydratase in catechol pathway n=1 Tax=Umezawaea tangerina TaxID=84725 RepID=A0A2T0T6K9_9PSEU|nr:fumarylacetoacetate hydrolase family protein [Umezawaea tangerina]PRY41313.1 2-keto-4-pentenoate hydratase/2-oxohepta-3-ene-1,7-dioic acid hydratase in catechol pathway [Umezawaea tangerina]
MRVGTVRRGATATAVVVAVDEHTAAVVPGYQDVAETLADQGHGDTVARARARGERVLLAEVRWAPPIRRPGKVLCVALNNSANPQRILSGPRTPAMFTKPSSSLIGHGEEIRLRDDYGRVHPEPELAVVIGTGGSDIGVPEAWSHVFGYTILNDLTSPTMRAEDTFHYRAVHPDPHDPAAARHVESWVSYPARYKGTDTFGPIGPWVVTADEVPDPHTLRIRCRHNGLVVTDDTTANLRFGVAEVISFASRYLALEPGDVIAMGTALRPSAEGGAVQNVDLTRLGGTVEVEIDGIGLLANPVVLR